jgi:serine/threonine protein kinase
LIDALFDKCDLRDLTMQPPIPTGTVLQNRYRILSILGQGGFGRTYLSEDQGRFNEPCALKEFMPPQSDTYALEKSKELFQREAQILYQIQHPQIPQFRATFEEDQRFFLVQDYVDGKTYRAMLDDRKKQGFVFSENEVTQLVKQVLPVLAYLHGKGIIHRDIAPDNVILRERDRLPVLIDFGVVKELATRIQQAETVKQQTTVGKLGYAPSEQMQTGRAYPNSDLYALAVTAVVLLTGREPQELFDESSMTWRWQKYVNVNPVLAQTLNRMLSYRVTDRFQSANEVLQALQAPATVAPYPASNPPVENPLPPPPPPPQATNKTIAIGRRNDESNVARVENTVQSNISTRSSLWDDPWAVFAIGTGLVLLTGLGAWTATRALMNFGQPTPLPTETVASPRPTTPSPRPTTPSPSPTAEPVTFSQKLDVSQGTASRKGTLKPNETLNVVVPGTQGQQLNTSISSEGVLLTVLAPNGDAVDNRATRVSNWSGELPFTGDYTIQLKTLKEVTKPSPFTLNVGIKTAATPSPSPSPSPSPTDSPSPSPSPSAGIEPVRVSIPQGQTQTRVSGKVGTSQIRRYVLGVQQGQTLGVQLTSGAATLVVRYPDGRPVEGGSDVVAFQGQVPNSGDYLVDVNANEATSITLDITVR